tara:strand:- start:24651 stop:25184 length:534 start_codon:yes stop_codon:yes gene_type:complete
MIYKVDFLTEEESDTIYNRILHLEPEIKALGEGRYGGTNKDSLTSRFVYYNGLEYCSTIGGILKPKLMTLFGRRRWFQCWYNTFRNGEEIKPHQHHAPDKDQHHIPTWTACNIFIGGDPSGGTYYDGEKFENKKGQLTFFDARIPHWTLPYEGEDVRITMAMDIHQAKMNPSMTKLV